MEGIIISPKQVKKDACSISNIALILLYAGHSPGNGPQAHSGPLWTLPNLCPQLTLMWSQQFSSFEGHGLSLAWGPLPCHGVLHPFSVLSCHLCNHRAPACMMVTSTSQCHWLPTAPSHAPTRWPRKRQQYRSTCCQGSDPGSNL